MTKFSAINKISISLIVTLVLVIGFSTASYAEMTQANNIRLNSSICPIQTSTTTNSPITNPTVSTQPLAAGQCDGSGQRVGRGSGCNGSGNRSGNRSGSGRRGGGRNGSGNGNGTGNGRCR